MDNLARIKWEEQKRWEVAAAAYITAADSEEERDTDDEQEEQEQEDNITLEDCVNSYVTGYLARSVEKKIDCSSCKKFMVKNIKVLDSKSELLIFNRKFGVKKDNDFGSLYAPTTL